MSGEKKFPTDSAKMRHVAEVLKKELPNLGFALLVFDFGNEGMSNYISNAQRSDMIKALEETLYRFKYHQDIKTPEGN